MADERYTDEGVKERIKKLLEDHALWVALDGVIEYCEQRTKEVASESEDGDDDEEAVNYGNMAYHLKPLSAKAKKQKL